MYYVMREPRKILEKKAVTVLEKSIFHILSSKEYATLGIVGGSSVKGVFENLKESNIPWKKVHIFMVDERLVPEDHPDSNYLLASSSLIDHLIKSSQMPAENAHPFRFEANVPDKGIKKYEEELKGYGDEIEILLLSAGEDGHIGALFPNHPSINNDSDYYLTMNDSPKLPKGRMTMSKALMQRSRRAIILFFGEGKREALELCLREKTSICDCPAKIITGVPLTYILTDITDQRK